MVMGRWTGGLFAMRNHGWVSGEKSGLFWGRKGLEGREECAELRYRIALTQFGFTFTFASLATSGHGQLVTGKG